MAPPSPSISLSLVSVPKEKVLSSLRSAWTTPPPPPNDNDNDTWLLSLRLGSLDAAGTVAAICANLLAGQCLRP